MNKFSDAFFHCNFVALEISMKTSIDTFRVSRLPINHTHLSLYLTNDA